MYPVGRPAVIGLDHARHAQEETVRSARTAILVATLLGTLAMGSACSAPVHYSVDGQLQETRALNSELRGEWQGAEDAYEATQTAIKRFSKAKVEKDRLDTALMKKALVECFESPLKPQNVSTSEQAACNGDSMTALRNLSQASDPDMTTFIQETIVAVENIKVNLKEQLPGKATNLAELYRTSKKKLEELRISADNIKSNADAAQSSDADRARFQSEYDFLQKEIQAVADLLESMETGALNLPDRVRKSQETFTQELIGFGD